MVYSNWKRWIKVKMIEKDCETRLGRRLHPTSSNKLTRITNNPTVATHAELLIIADELGIHAYELFCNFEVGAAKLTEEEKNLLRNHYVLQNTVSRREEKQAA